MSQRRVTDFLSAAEIRELTTASNLHGLGAVLTTWGIIAGSFAMVAWHPAPWTVLLAVILLGGRQLALSILMHEAAHRALFRTRWVNDVVGEWLCAAPAWNHLHAYRKHHLGHHSYAGTDRDPDAGLARPFPITRRSLLRKVARDLTGIAGLKRTLAQLAMDLGYIEYTASVDLTRIDQTNRSVLDVIRTGVRNLGPVLLTNAAMFGALWAVGYGWVYVLWPVAFLTTFSLFVRLRSMAEHGCTDWTLDPFLNTRTTLAGPLARLTVAPHRVNYHLEHHLLMTVPWFRLPGLHRVLAGRGALEGCHLASGYGEVLRLVTTPR